jgi:hypothetical protein
MSESQTRLEQVGRGLEHAFVAQLEVLGREAPHQPAAVRHEHVDAHGVRARREPLGLLGTGAPLRA